MSHHLKQSFTNGSILSPLSQFDIGTIVNKPGIIAIFFSMMLELKEILLPSY